MRNKVAYNHSNSKTPLISQIKRAKTAFFMDCVQLDFICRRMMNSILNSFEFSKCPTIVIYKLLCESCERAATGNTEEEDHPKKEGTINFSNSTEEEDHPKKEG